jgi:hypothetical protein
MGGLPASGSSHGLYEELGEEFIMGPRHKLVTSKIQNSQLYHYTNLLEA